ncbi:response regulator, partial [Chryseobacterium indoltheticum]|uniref:response regulator transcription factor n=1 Tax=Chryseobacterium indoltheticum TaxID=254 RepID=UPI0028ED93C1
MKKTIVIVDDHLLIAKAIEGIISNFEDFEVIDVAENGKDMIDKFESDKKIPDIILLDFSM